VIRSGPTIRRSSTRTIQEKALRRATWSGVLLFLSLLPLQAQEPVWKRVHETTLRGLDHLYALDVDDAVAAFDSVSRMATPADRSSAQ
jgi:hypothetical protein